MRRFALRVRRLPEGDERVPSGRHRVGRGEAFPDLDEDVRQSIARINASPFIPRKESVRGFVYDVRDGSLREVS